MFESSEYRQRLNNLQNDVKRSGLDALVIATEFNIFYLTGINAEAGDRKIVLVVPAMGEPALIVPRMEQEHFSAVTQVERVAVYWEKDAKPGRGWIEALQEVLGASRCVGVDPWSNMELLTALADYELQVSELVEDLRVIKSPAEIEITRRVAGYWTQAMNSMLAIAKVGLPIGELVKVGGEISQDIFSSEPSAHWENTNVEQFFQITPKSSLPHYFSYRAEDTLPHGPTIINAIGSVCAYNAENERTILTGEYTSEHAELFDITHQAHQLALSLVKPGVPCADVDCQVQAFFIQQGLAEHVRHRTGHGFGLVYHERPYTSEGSEEVYQPGMIISIEPGLYVEGVGGFRHSDTVLITEKGIENFTEGTPIDRASMTF